MNKLFAKRKIIRLILSIIAIVAFVFMAFMSFNSSSQIQERYNYSNEEISTYFNEGRTLDQAKIQTDVNTGVLALPNGSTVVQPFSASMSRTSFIKIYMEDANINPNRLKVSISDKDGTNEVLTTVQQLDDYSVIITPKEIVNATSDDKIITIYNGTGTTLNIYEYGKQSGMTLNDDSVNVAMIVGYDGYQNALGLELPGIILISFVFVLALAGLAAERFTEMDDEIGLSKLDEYELPTFKNYAIEMILSLATTISMFAWIYEYSFYYSINAFSYFISIALATITAIYIVRQLLVSRKDLARIFVIVMIPIGLLYWIFILPDYIPDEIAHFAKVFLTSEFKFTNNTSVDLPVTYSGRQLNTYYDFVKNIFAATDYTNTYTINNAVSYNVIAYIVPATVFAVFRILSLPIFVGYLAARLSNFCIFLFLGYEAVKATPIAKFAFLVYLFNPMMIHQGISLSEDMMVNGVAIFTVAYMFKVKFDDENISNHDILILCLCFGITLLTKYVYLPIFGLIFLSLGKLRRMNAGQYGLVIIGIVLSLGIYWAYNNLLPMADAALATNAQYLVDTGVNPVLQRNYLASNPLAIFSVVSATNAQSGQLYFYEFLGNNLGWLNINMPEGLSLIYLATMVLSAFVTKEEFSLKIPEKVWSIFLTILMYFLVVIGMYIYWSGVGAAASVGTQGRYFLPFIIIVVVCLIFKHNKPVIPYAWAYILAAVVVINVVEIGYVIGFFA